MPTFPPSIRVFRTLLASAALAAILLALPPIVMAQQDGIAPGETQATNPKLRGQTITASVGDADAPSTPILVSPEDNSLINESLTSFVWNKSTDEVGVTSYRLYLDGTLYFSDIPTNDAENDAYTLDFDSTTGYFTLTVAEPLDEGTHTWRVVALDAAGNSTTSVTWTFDLDSQAPTFVLTQIGDTTVSISAQDADSVPTSPLVLTENSPLLSGVGEEYSNVSLNISRSSQVLDTGTFEVDGDGFWSIQLGLLPRDVVLTLDFTITDEAGNVSVLNSVQLIIQSWVIQIPPQPSANPIVGDLGGDMVPPPSSPPLPIPDFGELPPIAITIVPPLEIASNFITQATQVLPSELQAYARLRPLILEAGPLVTFLSWLAVALLVMPIAFSAILVWTMFEKKISWTTAQRILQTLGIWPWPTSGRRAGGLAIDVTTQQALPYARIIVTGVDKQRWPIREIAVTNGQGFYPKIFLKPGNYTIFVEYPGAVFPTGVSRPSHVPWYNYYKGETVTSIEGEPLATVILPIEPSTQHPLHPSNTQRTLARLQFGGYVSIGSAVISSLAAILYPSLPNLLAIALYVAAALYQWHMRVRRRSGTITDAHKHPLPNAVLRLYDPENPAQAHLAQSSSNGSFWFPSSVTTQSLQVLYFDWKLAVGGVTSTAESREHLKVQVTNRPELQVVMKPVIL